MVKNVSKRNKKILPIFKQGSIVFLEKPKESKIKGLSHKLDNRALGPYQIIGINYTKGNAKLQIAPDTIIKVKVKSLILSDNQNIDLSYLFKFQPTNPKLLPSKLSEIIPITNRSEITRANINEKEGTKPKLSDHTVQTLINKRVNIYWSNSNNRGWHKGTVVGYNGDLSRSLIFYDIRTDGVDESIDYYSHNLFADSTKWKLL